MNRSNNKLQSSQNNSQDNSTLSKVAIKVGSTASIFVSLTFFLFLAAFRNASIITFFIGSIYNGILAKVLKLLIDQNRPDNINEGIKDKPNDKGMPSSHAMSLGFIGTGTAIAMPVLTIPLVVYVCVCLYYRIQMNLHTREQILVGLVVGSKFYFCLFHAFSHIKTALNSFFWQSLSHGTFPLLPQINILQMVSTNLLPASGILPIKYLTIPIIIGAAVVGSIERKIAKFITSLKTDHVKST